MSSFELGVRHRLGIPAIYILDQLLRGRTMVQILCETPSVLLEYRDAYGYSFHWGQLIEEHVLGQNCWRIMPVELWHELKSARYGTELQIAQLILDLHPVVRDYLRNRLPRGLLLSGCQAGRRISPHSLFTLVSSSAKSWPASRNWIGNCLLPEHLPRLLTVCKFHLEAMLDRAPRTFIPIGEKTPVDAANAVVPAAGRTRERKRTRTS